MCGRFTLRTPSSAFSAMFAQLALPVLPPRYNIAPTQDVAAVRRARSGGLELAQLRWGLIPFWVKEPAGGAPLINARSETAARKPAFREALVRRRCLVLADGFYEWRKTGAGKQPMYIYLKGDKPFCFAGLWETNKQTGEPVQSCAILTTEPNELMAPIHDRMPVILEPRHYEVWLDPEFQGTDPLQRMLTPFPADLMQCHAVSPRVNRATFEDPSCIEPVQSQTTLFP